MGTVSEISEPGISLLARAVATSMYATLGTVDKRGRARNRIVHPLWHNNTGWITTWRDTPKVLHLAGSPFVSLAYIADLVSPIAVDCTAEWVDDEDTRRWFWEWAKTVATGAGYDPASTYAIDSRNSGLLRLTPFRTILMDREGAEVEIWQNELATADATPTTIT